MASIAQEESRKTSERLKFGYKRSIEQGRVLGREPYGYFKKDGKLSINEAEAQIVRYIYEEYIKGKLGLRTICKELEERGVLARNGKPFGYSVLQNIIKNPKYKGYYCGRKTTIPDYRTGKKKKLDESEWIVYKDENIPALVSEELWDKANELLKSRGEKFKEHDVGNQNRYTYSGKLFCAEHGCSYHRHVYKSKSGEKECWNCRLYRLKGKDKGCDSPTIYSTELDEIMKVIINEIYTNREAFLDALFKRYQQYHTDRDFDLEIQKKQERIEELKKMKDTLLMLLNEGSIQKNEFIERNNQFNSEISKLEEQIESEKKQKHIFDKNLKAFNVLRKTMDDICEKGGKIDDSIIVLDKIIVHKTDQKNKLIKLDIRLKTGMPFQLLLIDKIIEKTAFC